MSHEVQAMKLEQREGLVVVAAREKASRDDIVIFLTWWTEKGRLKAVGTLLAGIATGCLVFPPLFHWSLSQAALYGVGIGLCLLAMRAITAAYLFFHVREHK